MNFNKRIVVISGVTGAIGSALFADYAEDPNTVIYGISRKAKSIDSFLVNGKLPLRTFICSLPSEKDFESLFANINYSVNEVIYVHAVGLYPFEVNEKGGIEVKNDLDNDGVNDEVTKLTFELFRSATTSLISNWKGKTKCVVFAGIADKYRPLVHQSWWRTIEKVKGYMKSEVEVNPNLSMTICNISSVLCPHEVITRPFVFTHTDADQTFWLHPYDLSRFVVETLENATPGFSEVEKFKIKPGFKPNDYYMDDNFTPRKVNELF